MDTTKRLSPGQMDGRLTPVRVEVCLAVSAFLLSTLVFRLGLRVALCFTAPTAHLGLGPDR